MYIDLDSFEKTRIWLIERLENGDISKDEYLSQSLKIFECKRYLEPEKLKTVQEGIFYYFYFNTLAKNYMKKYGADKSKLQASISNEYYDIKENVLFKLLALLSNDKIEAYFVRVDSIKLKNKLVEINIPEMKKIIFHTLRPKTISYLKRRGVLKNSTTCLRDSLISSYINKKYY